MKQSALRKTRMEIQQKLSGLLLERNLLSEAQLDVYRRRGDWLNQPLARLVRNEGAINEPLLLELLSEASGLPGMRLCRTEIDEQAIRHIPAKAVVTCNIMPVRLEKGSLVIATDRIREQSEEDHLRVLLGYTIHWVLCTTHDLRESIKHYYGVGIGAFLKLKAGAEYPDRGGDVPALVQEIIEDAILTGATDIHFEPGEETLRVRYRIDGVLYNMPLPRGIEGYAKALISALKVMAQLNIAERRLPQDGRFETLCHGETFDLRVSVLPGTNGETVNLRILNREATFISLDELGLEEDLRRMIDELITLPHGIVLFTGPTGSGKTTSLYAALDKLNDDTRKIITIEDPVEYKLEGITQLQVHSDIGFSFANGLRSILRHDPDVVLVGEIRDDETADIAVSAALTGHMVFSTLHTNDSASAVARLMDMGVEPYLIAASLQGVVAQRLIRRICPECKAAADCDPAIEKEIREYFPELTELPPLYEGVGCPSCRYTGYAGRRAIFEVLPVSEELRSMISERASSFSIMDRALDQGLYSLRQRAWHWVLAGETTPGEVMRVTRRTRKVR